MLQNLIHFFNQQLEVQVAFLFGSRARGVESANDWDFAVLFHQDTKEDRLKQLACLEHLRALLANKLTCEADQVDLIDLRYAALNLCITVANEGEILKGSDTLEIFHFYQRAWSGQEEFHFRKAHGY